MENSTPLLSCNYLQCYILLGIKVLRMKSSNCKAILRTEYIFACFAKHFAPTWVLDIIKLKPVSFKACSSSTPAANVQHPWVRLTCGHPYPQASNKRCSPQRFSLGHISTDWIDSFYIACFHLPSK